MDKDKAKKIIKGTTIALGATYVVLDVIAKKQKKDSIYQNDPDQQNPMQGKSVEFVENPADKEDADGECGHLEATGLSAAATRDRSFYEKVVKRGLDKTLSFAGLVALAPVMGGIALAIKIEDPGPVLFTQKRVGQDKQYFKLHKFRSMKMSTPHDVPTHMLDHPEQYITKIGGFIRKHSLDELPQIWDIFVGNMSVIGPRPALWNQDVLVAERDKVGANDVKPGLTGWAQINGRDELEIPEKAKLDGVYTEALEKGGLEAAKMDAKCFTGSIHVFGSDNTVIEGGTGSIAAGEHSKGFPDVDTTPTTPKHILITGANSYIGDSVKEYLDECNNALDSTFYDVQVRDTMNWEPTPTDFDHVDVVFNVAGIAHRKETDENRHLYYEVNKDLVVKIAKAAKDAGVKQFVLLSSMSVYGKTVGRIEKSTEPAPTTAYGMSKLEADEALSVLADDSFRIATLRPPMVYGKGCKGNYQTLRKFALKSPIFPNYKNSRSMIYIGNLCEFVKRVIDTEAAGLFFPQNSSYVNTAEMVRLVALDNGKKINEIGIFNPAVKVATKTVSLVSKVFGNLTYEKVDRVSKYGFEESIEFTEKGRDSIDTQNTEGENNKPATGKKALFIASMGSMLDNFNRANIKMVQDLGYDVTLAANFNTSEDTNSHEKIMKFCDEMKANGCHIVQIDFGRSISHVGQQMKSIEQVRELLKRRFDLVHCHSPICAAITRVEYEKYRKQGGKLIYTAHGFHFYDGAPKKNWLIFYTIEKALSKYTDILITINKEDYNRAKNEFYAKKTVYVPGVGVDTKKFETCHVDHEVNREELGVPEDGFVMLSVGELSDRKNQRVVIEAFHKIKEENADIYSHLYYLMAGRGDLEEEYKELITKYGLDNHVIILGYRTDIGELCETVDCFVHPSVREGLGIAPLEAMATGLPLISSYLNGMKDYTEDGKSGVCIDDPTSADAMAKAIVKMYHDPDFRESCGTWNYEEAKKFDINRTDEIMSEVYSGGYRHLMTLLKRQEIRSELGIPQSAFVIMSTGELNDNKNHAVVIRAIALLKDPDIHYIIAGQGENKEKLRKFIAQLNVGSNVHLLGFRSDISDLLHSADCFAFPSKREGLGLAAIEAMASGLPLLTSNNGGINDYSVDGETGFKFDADDVDGFVRGIEKLKSNPNIRYKFGNRANAISKEFDISKAEEVMQEVYTRN